MEIKRDHYSYKQSVPHLNFTSSSSFLIAFYSVIIAKSMANRNMTISLLSFCTVFIFIVSKIPTLSFATSSNETDFQALLDFKNRIQSDPSHFLNSWNDSLHFCDWPGITCGKRHKRVVGLNVSSLDLVGTLSPSVGNLSFLQEIYLYDNSFHGVIPPEIGRLFRLRYLVFENNSFHGQIPANLTLCKDLRLIGLNANNLSGSIPDQMSALSKLQVLELAKNNFTGYIPPSLGNISSLQYIELTYNSLSGNIPRELAKLFNLQGLGLAANMLSGPFPVEICNISSIQVLSIADNFLTGQFPDTLGLTLPKLTDFLIESNNFSGSIPSTLANASGLAKIDIGDNMLTGPIPRNLGMLQQLRWLRFQNNPLGIDKDNDISFITTLTNCTNLVELDLSILGIGGILPLEISNLSRKLSTLNLYENRISGGLPTGIGELVGLSLFSVHDNTLSGSIPPSIGKLINMKQLYLYDNYFTGEIPPSIGDISGLLTLALSQNMLSGSIPLTMSNLTDLQELDLSQNNLTGALPKEVFSMTSKLIVLNLDQNKFNGSLPSEIGVLNNLVELTVSGNGLSGEIPVSIGDCQMLETLEVEGNFLDGTIPSTLGKLKSIEVMDLSRNKLSGEIPASLETLKFINFLNLSFNMLEGEVPRNGFFANASALSIVGNERLCGGIKSLNLSVCPPKDSIKRGKLSTHMIIILVICILIALVSLFGSTHAIFQRRKSSAVPSSTSPEDKRLLKISYDEILTSTDGFSSENLIGDGKYGSVYRGVLKPSEKVVAVKVLKLQLKGAHKSFLAECEALRNIRHRNLVKIVTSCSSIDFKGNEFKALILEYVPNGSLEEWLHQNASAVVNKKKLDLLERLNIAIDIATALDYLHNHYGNPIVHCDIKPSNVLLGDDLRGLVCDFGLAKFLLEANDIESTSIGIRGTIGYVAPEYGMGGDVSAKGDVYSYGILLLEMFTGKRPTDTMFTEDCSLHNYVKTALHDRVAEIIDPELLTMEDNEDKKSNYTSAMIESCCLSIFRVGISCSSEMQKERMDINDAIIELQHIRNKM